MAALTALCVVVVVGAAVAGVAITARPTHCSTRTRTFPSSLKRAVARRFSVMPRQQELGRPDAIDGALIPTESGSGSVEEEVLAGRRRVTPGQHLTSSQEEN